MDNVEADGRMNDLILSGNVLPVHQRGENTRAVCVDVLKNHLKYEIPSEKILSAYRLGNKAANQEPDRRSILVRLTDRASKGDVIASCKTSKPAQLFINENLTPAKSKILFTLRAVKRRLPEKIRACGSRDGRIFVWMRAPSTAGRDSKIFINSQQQLYDLCVEKLNLSAEELSLQVPEV